MPLQSGSSRAAFEHNVKKEIEAGKPQKQALAIAYREKGEDLASIALDALSLDGPAERIAGAWALYNRPGTPGEKQAAAEALRRMGIDPAKSAPPQQQAPPRSSSSARPSAPQKKKYEVVLSYEWTVKSGKNKGKVNTATTPQRVVYATDEIDAERIVREMFRAGRFGADGGKTPEFRHWTTKRVADSLASIFRDGVYAAGGLSDFYTAPTREDPLRTYLKYGGGDFGEVGDGLSRIARDSLLGPRDGLAEALERVRGGVREQTE